jgi:hypothetical protein
MPNFIKTLKTWNTSDFNDTLKNEIAQMDINQLPLQQALTQSSHVSDSGFSFVILNTSEEEKNIIAKAGIFFSGVVAGSCCADDPTPADEVSEYCEVEFCINKDTGEVYLLLLDS